MTTEAPTTDYCMSCDTSARAVEMLRHERDCLRVKNKRMREALEEIASDACRCSIDSSSGITTHQCVICRALAEVK